MSIPYFSGATLDDVMRWVLQEILWKGEDIHPTKGPAKELSGVLLEITNPLARISRTETKGRPFSCLGELCWYLAKAKDLSFISYYLPLYRKYADNEEIFGGYGPRLFDWFGRNQFANVANILKRRPDSRQAVIQLFSADDIVEAHKDVPCTCTMQFLVRQNRLHLITNMRSNDAWIGMPHDIFCFTMLQEIMARTLSVEIGPYKHMVGSLHLYNNSMENARKYLDEGWQSTIAFMEPMPSENPWPAISAVLKAERAIRADQGLDYKLLLDELDAYWADLVRLLLVFRAWKARDAYKIRELRDQMTSSVYDPFIENRFRRL